MGKWTEEEVREVAEWLKRGYTTTDPLGENLTPQEQDNAIADLLTAQQRVVEATKELKDFVANQHQIGGNWAPRKRTPVHGPCCACQECGYVYENCMCHHNKAAEIVALLDKALLPFTDTPCEECGGSEVVDSIGSGEHLQTIYCSTCTPDTEEEK